MKAKDLDGVLALQRACFPAPFPESLLWQRGHLVAHLSKYPEGQFVAVLDSTVIGSASACLIQESAWKSHASWSDTVGGPYLEGHDPSGTTLYGLDISVHPEHRSQGVGRALYSARFDLVRECGLERYGTACRLPGYAGASAIMPMTVEHYCLEVNEGRMADRTMTPLLRYGLRFLGVIHDYMEDPESANSAALLEWTP